MHFQGSKDILTMIRFGHEMNRPSIELQAQPQSGEAQFHTGDLPAPDRWTGLPWKAWLGYRRAIELDQIPDNQGVGQDDAALRSDDRYVVGVLCDGVSQSFYGDIAATQLTESLLDRLWATRDCAPERSLFEDWLIDIEAEIAQTVAAYRIPERIQTAIRAKMEARKSTVGSQSVMCAFVLDRDVKGGLLNVYQIGDAFTCAYISGETSGLNITSPWKAVHGSSNRFSILHLQCDPGGRIRSIGNSQRHLVHAALTGVVGVALYSDGVPANWAASLSDSSRPNSITDDLEVWAGRDDASFVVAFSPEIDTFLNNPVRSSIPPPPERKVIELPGVVEIDYHWGSRVLLLSLSLPVGETATLISPTGLELETEGSNLYLVHKPGVSIDGQRIELALSDGKRYTIRHSIVIVDPVFPPEKPSSRRTKTRFRVPTSALLVLLLAAGTSTGYYLIHKGRTDPITIKQGGQVPPASPAPEPTRQLSSDSHKPGPDQGANGIQWTKAMLQTPSGQKEALHALGFSENDLKTAIKQYQRKHKLRPADGKAGPQTQKQLLKDLNRPAKSKANSSSRSNTQ
ncbi:MAG: hypothetical protein JWL77_4869 [Chthonomonadaceae bacterium]|nr:hypothetical protein [Chthonomonadaceae bacterium]